ncbi:YceI family protein [Nocardioides sp.]|uniref:YceI family protein n=1 Tax=Nocardioides sp. TaxID=35761 RepID=UPI002630C6E4|nr:YceI family protein [Nocardioides sp.]MBI2243742.1 YceI family protein [Nocardioides sp.]MDI6910702.1 YceI family protein [Nocardioides sp.]
MSFFNRKPAEAFDAPTAAVEDISGDYTIDPAHTRIGFSTRHAMVTTVRGQFGDFAGTAHVDAANPNNSRVEIVIQTASIDTGVADRDAHLRSADFFDADQNKEITFVSTKVERGGQDWVITGDLTIKGVTKPVTVAFEPNGSARDPFGNLRIGFEGGTAINRKDWDLTWNAALETGGVLVSEKVKLEFDVSAIRNA